MTKRNRSESVSSQGSSQDERLAQLEQLLSNQLFSSSSTSINPTISAPPPAVIEPAPTEHEPELVSFRLFSSQKAPTSVVIREAQELPPISVDRRIRAVEDEDPQVVAERKKRIESIVVDGTQILDGFLALPSPYPPSFRLTHRTITKPPHAPATSTRSVLPLPRLAFLNSLLPSSLHSSSPNPVPTNPELEKKGILAPTSTEGPNHGLIKNGPYERVASRMGLMRDLKKQKGRKVVQPVAMNASKGKGQESKQGEEGKESKKTKKDESRTKRQHRRSTEMTPRLPLSLFPSHEHRHPCLSSSSFSSSSSKSLHPHPLKLEIVPVLNVEKEQAGLWEKRGIEKKRIIEKKVRAKERKRRLEEKAARVEKEKEEKKDEGESKVKPETKATSEIAKEVENVLIGSKKMKVPKKMRGKRVSKARRQRIKNRLVYQESQRTSRND